MSALSTNISSRLDAPKVDTNLLREISRFLSEIADRWPHQVSAGQVYSWAIALDNHNAVAWNGLGVTEMAAGRAGVAELAFRKAGRMSSMARAYLNAAVAADKQRKFCSAAELATLAWEMDPSMAESYLELASLAGYDGDLGLAESWISKGLGACPGHHDLGFAMASVLLGRGSYQPGWEWYEHRPCAVQLYRSFDECPVWRGAAMPDGLLLIIGEQGIGDQIMFSRYIRPAAERFGGKVVFYTRPELARLFELLPGASAIVTSDAQLIELEVDFWIPLCSLPWVLGIVEPLQLVSGDLVGPAELPRHLGNDDTVRVGLCWAGSPEHSGDRFRSISFEILRPLLSAPGCSFYSLQCGPAAFQAPETLPRLAENEHDILDAAASVAAMDGVITVDTCIAHLAGALEKPTWLLLGQAPDWRWGTDGTVSAWYPHVRIIRGMDVAAARVALEVLPKLKRSPLGTGIRGVDSPTTGTGDIITRQCRYGQMSYYRMDKWLGRALDLYGEWSEGEAELFRSLLRSGDVVVEAGANIGSLTLPLADAVGISGEVWAFEPHPQILARLRENVMRQNVTLHREALGNSDGIVSMRLFDPSRVCIPGGSEGKSGDYQQVPVCCLDSFGLVRLDFLKVDVGGYELKVVQGGAQTIARCRPILCVDNQRTDRSDAIIRCLEDGGYRVYQHLIPLFNPRNYRRCSVNVFGGLTSTKLLCIPQERRDLCLAGMERVRTECARH